MSDTKIAPALTPEEWAHWSAVGWFDRGERLSDLMCVTKIDTSRETLYAAPNGELAAFSGTERHALAALALHGLKDTDGKPLGFTHEHLALLTRLVVANPDISRADFIAADRLHGIIRALLPPETE